MISGLVVYLTEDDARADLAREVLRSDPHIEMGIPEDPLRVPVVMDSQEEGREAVRRLEAITGVERVEVAFIGLDDE